MQVNQLKAGVVLNYVLLFLHSLVGLVYTPYMLRCMGQSEYGLYSLVASVVAYLTVLDLGMGNAVVRYTAKYRAENKYEEQYEMFGMFFILHTIMSVVVLIVGCVLYSNVENMFDTTMTDTEISRAKVMLILLIFNMAFTFPMSLFGSIITAYENYVFQKLINIARVVLNTALMIVLLSQGYKAVAMVVVTTVFNVVTLLINYFYCKRNLGIKLYFRRFKIDFLKEVAIYSFWILLNVIMDRVYWSTGQFVLGAYVGTVAVSVFAVAIHLESTFLQFSTAVVSVFLPKVTKMVASKSTDREISALFIKTGRIQYIILGLILSCFIVFGRSFIHLWAGDGYDEAYLMTVIFFFALLTPLIQNLGITILQARNQMKFRSLCYVVIAIFSLLFQILLAPKYGGMGCAISVAGALLLGQGLIMNIYYAKVQHIDILLFWKEIMKMSVIPIVATLVGLYIFRFYDISSWNSMLIGATIYCLVYIPLFWVFSMNNEERTLFIAPLKRILKV